MRDLVFELRRIADEIDRGAHQAHRELDRAAQMVVDGHALRASDRPTFRTARAGLEASIAAAHTDAQLVRSAADLVERLRAQHRVADP